MHFDPKKYTKIHKMRVIQNKGDMISYYQLKKNWKKSRGGPKIGSKLSKLRKFDKNWYYMHFDPKQYTKNYKMRLILNKYDMISYHQLKKWEKLRKFAKFSHF